MNRTILHIDMDAFYASVEQRDHPELKGKPVIVGAAPDQRGVVSAVSYEARPFGIHSAMPSRTAFKLCPQAVFVPVNMQRYEEVSIQIQSIFERYTPLVEPLSLDEAFLDVTGVRNLFGDGVAMARLIRTAIVQETGLTASVGVASNKFLAKIASDLDKPDGLTVVPDDADGIRAFLAPLPVGRLWGVGKVTRAVLEKAGLRTIGDLQRLSLASLAQRVGENSAEQFKALAQGLDERPVETDWIRKSISREYTFPQDCADRQELVRVLGDCVEDVGRQLREVGRYAGDVQLKVRWADFTTITRQKTLNPPVCDDTALRSVCMDLFGAVKLVASVRLIGFGVGRLEFMREQQLLLFDEFSSQRDKHERLSRTVDRIRKRFGSDSITRAAARRRGEGA